VATPQRPVLPALSAWTARHRTWLPILLLALLFAGLGQVTHLHQPDALGHDGHDDHCSFCLQFDRVGPGLSTLPSIALQPAVFAPLRWRPSPAVATGTAHRYAARGPPAP